MYENIIWIDSKYWFWTLLGLTFAIRLSFAWANRGATESPANGLALSVMSCFGAIMLIAIGLSVLHFFGLDLGMNG